jgi:hypothetical protein
MRLPIPILPRRGLFLAPYGHGDELRFARQFLAAWRRLRLGLRRLLLAYWRRPDPERAVVCDFNLKAIFARDATIATDPVRDTIAPRIELVHGWRDGRDIILPEEDLPTPGDPFAAVFGKGYLLRFRAPLVDRMPDGVVQDLVAHELAHVYQQTIDLKRYFGYAPCPGELEEHADECMERWGFDAESIDRWSEREGLTKKIECKDLDEYLRRCYGPGSRYERP